MVKKIKCQIKNKREISQTVIFFVVAFKDFLFLDYKAGRCFIKILLNNQSVQKS